MQKSGISLGLFSSLCNKQTISDVETPSLTTTAAVILHSISPRDNGFWGAVSTHGKGKEWMKYRGYL